MLRGCGKLQGATSCEVRFATFSQPDKNLCVCSYIRTVTRTNSCKNVVLQGCGKLRGAIFYFLATMSSQMDVEVVNDVDPEYYLNPLSIISIQVHVGDLWVGVLWAYLCGARSNLCRIVVL